MAINLLFIVGTRPEAIKLAPLIKEARNDSYFNVFVCSTGQHSDLLDQALSYFDIKPDINLKVMTENQSLPELMINLGGKISELISKQKFDLCFVQGDTTSACIAALTAFYSKIKVVHIEAGLRSETLEMPFPEEGNRKMISAIASYHFAPTKETYNRLIQERAYGEVHNVGNTVIDALNLHQDADIFSFCPELNAPFVLLTAHRRESFGKPLLEIFDSIKTISNHYPEILFLYPVHPNPNVKDIAYSEFKEYSNILLVEPLDYPLLVSALKNSLLVITDSGGIQEEAPTFNKYCLVLREVTERTESVELGLSFLVGHDKLKILSTFDELIKKINLNSSNWVNPYGDGNSSKRILSILKNSVA